MDPSTYRRAILRLAVPAFLTLVAEPLFLLADSAIVGHLGTPQLAGLGIAGAVLSTVAGVCVFLAYGTTAAVARLLGAGSVRDAVSAGLDGLWLGLGLGGALAVVVAVLAEPLCSALGADAATLAHATVYLRIASLGLPAMLATMAVTGVLRGLLDTRTPLIASVLGFTGNIVLNLVLVYGVGLGLPGSAWGTVIAQTLMAAGLIAVVLRRAAHLGAPRRPHPGRVLRAAANGVPLVIRTLALRATLLLTTWLAAGLGAVPLAAYQVSATVWTFLAFALDAIAIAGQALTGHALGAGDAAGTRTATSIMVRWGVGSGVVLGIAVIALHTVLPPLFTQDPDVRAALSTALLAVGLAQPICGYAFVLDGVLIGAGDARWLALAQVGVLVGYAPVVALARAQGPALVADGYGTAMVGLWAAYTTAMLLRAIALGARARGNAWLRTGTAFQGDSIK